MNLIQLDEDFNSRHLVEACSHEGFVEAIRFPAALCNCSFPDHFVLKTLLPLGNPILTLDQGFVIDHLQAIPDRHPGILVVGFDDQIIKSITTHTAQGMIYALKQAVPDWHLENLTNSIVNVKNSTITVSHCENHYLFDDALLNRDDADWPERLLDTLRFNATR